MKESHSSIIFRHWIKSHPQITGTFEIKTTNSSSFPFSEVKEAQLDWARAIRSDKGVLIRMQAVAEGMPDYAYFRNAPSWIVIHYPRMFVIINPEIFIHESKISKRRSLTASRAEQLATITVKV